MTQMTNFAENKIADFMRGQGLTLPATWYLALGSAASDAAFTELSGTSYARIGVARSLANFAGTQGAGSTLASAGTSHASSNNAAVSWGNPGSAWGTANYVGFFDATTAGNCWFWFPITPIVITTGSPNPVEIAAGALGFALGVSGGMSDYLSNKMLDLLFRAQAFTWPATLGLAYFTTAPTNAGGGVEPGAGSYARKALVPSLTSLSGTQSAGSTVASSGTSGRISNNASLAFPAPTADQGIAVAEGIYDATTLGNLLFWKARSPKSISNGGPAPTIAANAMGLTLD